MKPEHVSDGLLRDGVDPGPVSRELIDPASRIPGFASVDDLHQFWMVLRTQAAAGFGGDVLEIGTYHGQAAFVLARGLEPGERLHVNDVFDLGSADHYARPPTEAGTLSNVVGADGAVADGSVVVHRCRSEDLDIAPDSCRFVHVDGDHSAAATRRDLELAARVCKRGGVIALDDFEHPKWPEITPAARAFLAERDDVRVMADVNRHNATGRKLYLARVRDGVGRTP